MKAPVKRLSAEDWERAALEAIAEGGLPAVAVEPLARRLGVTKGSFYAHFADRAELVDAALRRWEKAHVDAFAASVQASNDPAAQLRSLITLAAGAARTRTIQSRLLLESDDPRVRTALKRVTEIRLRRLESIFMQLGHSEPAAARRATIAYAIYIGLLQLAREVPARLDDESALVEELTHVLSRA
jgi:AcrR family transcriptional regulator